MGVREEILKKRKQYNAKQYDPLLSQNLEIWFKGLKKFGAKIKNIGLFVPLQSEASFSSFAQFLSTEPVTCFFPHLILNPLNQSKENQMVFRQVDSIDYIRALSQKSGIQNSDPIFEKGPLGILQPNQSRAEVDPNALDLILVPGVVFDRNGARMGFGKGFYDRYLIQAKQALRVGVAYQFQVLEHLQQQSWDQCMHFIVTEQGVFPNE